MNDQKIKVLIDCDTGIDDIVALSYALVQDRLDVLGITTVAGNQRIELTTDNTLQALSLMGRSQIPVARGAAEPLCRPLVDAGYIHGDNGLGGYRFPAQTVAEVVEQSAPDFLYHILNRSEEALTIIALAPLTNIALLLKLHPEIKNKIARIVFMGGSIRTGNPTPISTFNVLCDPEAAKFVLASKIPFTMCSLDCTRKAYLTEAELDVVRAWQNPVARMIAQVSDFYLDTSRNDKPAKRVEWGLSIHDLITVIALTHPDLFSGEDYFVDVETKGELSTGFTMVDYEDKLRKAEADKTVHFLLDVRREELARLYLDTLSLYEKGAGVC